MQKNRRLLFSFILAVFPFSGFSGECTLFDFRQELPSRQILCRCADARQTKHHALYMRLKPGNLYPEVCLRAPLGKWDLTPFAILHVRISNVGTEPAQVGLRIDNPGADGVKNCLQVMGNIVPGQSYEYNVPLARLGKTQIPLFGMRGYPVEFGSGAAGKCIDPSNVTCLRFFGYDLPSSLELEIERIWADGQYEDKSSAIRPETAFPCIDTYGQFIHRSWPGKITEAKDLQNRRDEEEKDLAAHPGSPDWDRWGGWEKGPSRKATGFFRLEKIQGKWWLVDPAGKLFISHGIDCVGTVENTPVEGRERWFQNFPGKEAAYSHLLTRANHVVNGHYAGKKPLQFDFETANLMRKYGKNWENTFRELVHRRLRSWGMNTLGCWSKPAIYLMRRTPYFACLGAAGPELKGSTGYWGKFKDVFAPEFEQIITKRFQAEIGKSAGDPWCIGYFVDNELGWGDEISLAVGTLRSPASQPAKKVFLSVLQGKYHTISKLNQAWGTRYATWDAFQQSTAIPRNPQSRRDLLAFNRQLVHKYFSTIKKALRSVAPHQLYFGCRFAGVPKMVAEIAAEYCDGLCYNVYKVNAADARCKSGKDVPIIIGEFHFGALDRGMFHTGLVSVTDQAARGNAYRDYWETALKNPQVVGCHWFKFMDEPVTGRTSDGENYQIGFVDIADTPYAETIQASRDIGARMYQIRSAAKVPKEEIRVINAGYPGDSTAQGLARLNRDVIACHPDLVICMFGINDSCNPWCLQSLSQFSTNLDVMIRRIRAAGTQKILLITPHPIASSMLLKRSPMIGKRTGNRPLNTYINDYAECVRKAAVRNHTLLLDLHKTAAEKIGSGLEKNSLLRNPANSGMEDGVHFTAAGSRFLAEQVYGAVKDILRPGETVVCFGDSVTASVHLKGAGTVNGETYPAQLWRLLNPERARLNAIPSTADRPPVREAPAPRSSAGTAK